jgi:hypothetical protein
MLEVYSFYWSISKMCCIIFKLGCDAHMNIIKSHNKNHFNVSVIRIALNATTIQRQSGQVNP